MKMHLNIWSAKRWPFCPEGDELIGWPLSDVVILRDLSFWNTIRETDVLSISNEFALRWKPV